MESGTAAQSTDPQCVCVVSDEDQSADSVGQQNSEKRGVCGGGNSDGGNLQTKSLEDVHSEQSHPLSSSDDTTASQCTDLEMTSNQQNSAVSYEAGSWYLYAHCTASSQMSFQSQGSEAEKGSQMLLSEQGQEELKNKDACHSQMQSGYQCTPDQGQAAAANGIPSEGNVSSEQLRTSLQYEHPSDDYQGNQTEHGKGSQPEANSSLMHQSGVQCKTQIQYSYSHSDEMNPSSGQQLEGEAVHCQGEGGTESCSSGQGAQSGTSIYSPSTESNTHSGAATCPQDNQGDAANCLQDPQGGVTYSQDTKSGDATYSQDAQRGVAAYMYSQDADSDTAPCPQFDISTYSQAAQSDTTTYSQGAQSSISTHLQDIQDGAGSYVQDAETTTSTYAQDGSGSYAQDGSGSYAQDGSGSYAQDGSGSYAQDGSGSYAQDGSGSYAQDGSGSYAQDGSGSYAQNGSGSYAQDGSGNYSQDTQSGTNTYSQSVHSGTGGTYLQDVQGSAAATYSQGAWNSNSTYSQDAQSGTTTCPQGAYGSINTYSQSAHDGNSAYLQDTQSGAGTYSQDAQSTIATYSYGAQGDTSTYSQDAPTTYMQSAENIYSQSAQTGTGTYSQDAQTTYSQSAENISSQNAQTGTGTYSQDAQTTYSQTAQNIYSQNAQTGTGTYSQDAQTTYSQTAQNIYSPNAQTGTGTYSQDAQTTYSQSAENIYSQSAQTETGTYSQDAQTTYSQSAENISSQNAQTGTGMYSQDAQTNYLQSAENIYSHSAQTGTDTYSQDAQSTYSQTAQNIYSQSSQTGTYSSGAENTYSSNTHSATGIYTHDNQSSSNLQGAQNSYLWDVQGGTYSQGPQAGTSDQCDQQMTSTSYQCNGSYSSGQYTQYSQYPQQKGYPEQYSDGKQEQAQHNSSSNSSEYANHYEGTHSGSYYYGTPSAAAQQQQSTQQYSQIVQSQQQDQVYGQGYPNYEQQGYQQGYCSNVSQAENGSRFQNYNQQQSQHWEHSSYGNQSTGSHPQNQQLHAVTNYQDPPDSASSYYYQQQQAPPHPLPDPQQWPQPPPTLPPHPAPALPSNPPPALPPYPPPGLPPQPPPVLPPYPPPALPPHPLMPPHPQLPPQPPPPPQPPQPPQPPPQSLPEPQWPHHPEQPWLQQQYSQERDYNSEAGGYSTSSEQHYPGSTRPWRESGHRRFRGPPHHWRQRGEKQTPYGSGKRFGSLSGHRRQGGGSPSFDSRGSPSGSSTPSLHGYSPKYSPSKSSSPQFMETEIQSSHHPNQSPMEGNSKEDEEVCTTFSKHLHDPRQTQVPSSKPDFQSSEEKHYTRRSKYAGFAKNPVHKRSAMLKLSTWKHKPPDKAKGPQLIQPHHQRSENDKADSTQQKQKKSKVTEVHLSPKPLASFKIPKHKSSSEKASIGVSRVTGERAAEKREATEKGEATENKEATEKKETTDSKGLEIQSQPESTLKASIGNSGSKNDVVSILSSCDPTTLKALALTIQQTLLATSPVTAETSDAAKVMKTQSPRAIVPAQKIVTIEMDPSSDMNSVVLDQAQDVSNPPPTSVETTLPPVLQSSIGESTDARTKLESSDGMENMNIALTLHSSSQSHKQVPATSLVPTAIDSAVSPSQPQMAEKGVGTKSDPPPIVATVVRKPLFPVSTVQSLTVPMQNAAQQTSSLSDIATTQKVTTATPSNREVMVSTANISTVTAVEPTVSTSSLSAASVTITDPVATGTLHKESIVSATPSRITIPTTTTPTPAGESQFPLTTVSAHVSGTVVTNSDPGSPPQAVVVTGASQASTASLSNSADVSEVSDSIKESNIHTKEECGPESKSTDLNLTQQLKPSPDLDDNSDSTGSNSDVKPESQTISSGDKKSTEKKSTEGIESEHQQQETTEPASVRELSHFVDYFDPRFMFKEYNLRRTRKPPPLIGVAGGDMPPTKKQKKESEDSAQCKLSVSKEAKANTDSSRHKADVVCGEHEKQLESGSLGEKAELDSEAMDIDATVVEGTKERSHNGSQCDRKDRPLAVPCLSMEISLTPIAVGIPKSKEGSPIKQGKRNNKEGKPVEILERVKQSTLEESDKQEEETIGGENTGSEKPASKHAPRMKKSSPVKRSRKRRQLAVSEKNSYESVGETLLCALCRQRANVADLGFLFGPYEQKGVLAASNNQEESVNLSSKTVDTKLVDLSVSPNQEASSLSFWVHEDCVVWAPGVCLVNNQLMGLQEAVSDATKMVCSSCKRPGATLCCSTRGCKAVYHYPCASESGCSFKGEQFLVYCPRHKDAVSRLTLLPAYLTFEVSKEKLEKAWYHPYAIKVQWTRS